MSGEWPLAAGFPPPGGPVRSALYELRIAAVGEDDESRETERVADLPRPWDPPTCSPNTRREIYLWLDAVVGWINEEHTWRTDRVVPICWDLHPHIVHELAVVACSRWETSMSRTPAALEEWHRVTLPTMLERIADRIGETGCPPGRHQPNPGVGRNAIYQSGDESARRRRRRSGEI